MSDLVFSNINLKKEKYLKKNLNHLFKTYKKLFSFNYFIIFDKMIDKFN